MIDLLASERVILSKTIDDILLRHNSEHHCDFTHIYFNGHKYHSSKGRHTHDTPLTKLDPPSFLLFTDALKKYDTARLEALVCNQSLSFVRILCEPYDVSSQFIIGSCVPKIIHEHVYDDFIPAVDPKSEEYLEGCRRYPHPDHLVNITKLEKVIPLFQKYIVQNMLIL